MKTSNTKESTRSKTTRTTNVASKARKSKALRPEPDEEEVRKKAREIYNKRVKKGEPGTELDDWYKAEKLLKRS